MTPLGNDRWAADLPLERVGRYLFAIEAWRDEFAIYRIELQKKHEAGLPVALELKEGEAILFHALGRAGAEAAVRLENVAERLKTADDPGRARHPARRGNRGNLRSRRIRERSGSDSMRRLRSTWSAEPRNSPAGTSYFLALRAAILTVTARSTTSPADCRPSATWASTSSTFRPFTRSARPIERAETTRSRPARTIRAAPMHRLGRRRPRRN